MALDTLLKHPALSRLLESTEFIFHFIERNDENLELLRREIDVLGALPQRIVVHSHSGDGFTVLDELLDGLGKSDSQIAPAFIFVDPYGFKVPGSTLRKLMAAGRVELFINVMWRELYMDLSKALGDPGLASAADLVFDGPEWRQALATGSYDERADAAVDLLAKKLGSRWATSVRMRGDNGATRYILLHLTNHVAGRDLMKECVWKICPEGGFAVRKNDNLAQQWLITREPELRPLRIWVLDQLRSAPLRWKELHVRAQQTMWLDKHVNQVVRLLRKKREIEASEYAGVFSAKANPRLALAQHTPRKE